MFQSLTNKFEGIFERLSKKGVLSEDDVDEALREIRIALLEADVNLAVVKSLRGRIKERAVGEEVHKALNPAQQVVKIVNEELTESLGGETISISYAAKPPTVVLMAGLQGSGKTTSSGKLAKWFKAQGRNPLLVGADLQRPAAVKQLETLGAQIDVPVFSHPSNPVEAAARAIDEARETGRDVVIVDTAGRLAIDEVLMDEVRQISEAVKPDYTFLVVDAMTGQDAVNVAQAFHEKLLLDGVILTKLDGDARGGAALSVKEVVGRPIAFAGTGEKLDEFDLFHPDRMASRILGMGDMLTLIEKAEETFEKDQAEETAARMLEGQFTLDDFVDTMQQLRKMGPLQNLVGMMPGLPKEARDVEIDEREVARLEAMVFSMTPQERAEPELIDAARRTRIAHGSGTMPGAVSDLVKQFMAMRKMMKRFGDAGTKRIKKGRKKREKKKNKRSGGGRTTPKGGGRVTPKATKVSGKKGLTLPGLENVSDRELEKFGATLEEYNPDLL